MEQQWFALSSLSSCHEGYARNVFHDRCTNNLLNRRTNRGRVLGHMTPQKLKYSLDKTSSHGGTQLSEEEDGDKKQDWTNESWFSAMQALFLFVDSSRRLSRQISQETNGESLYALYLTVELYIDFMQRTSNYHGCEIATRNITLQDLDFVTITVVVHHSCPRCLTPVAFFFLAAFQISTVLFLRFRSSVCRLSLNPSFPYHCVSVRYRHSSFARFFR